MDSKKLEELTREMFGDKAKKLSLNDLEGVSGGVIEEDQVEGLKSWLSFAKSSGATKEQCVTFAPLYLPQINKMYPNVTLVDIRDFINTYYESV